MKAGPDLYREATYFGKVRDPFLLRLSDVTRSLESLVNRQYRASHTCDRYSLPAVAEEEKLFFGDLFVRRLVFSCDARGAEGGRSKIARKFTRESALDVETPEFLADSHSSTSRPNREFHSDTKRT